MLTRAQVTALIMRNDEVGMHAIGRALVHLLRRQTDFEAVHNVTKNLNERGFAPADARRGCIAAKYYIKHKKLEDWQLDFWRKPNRRGVPRLAKYWAQLAEEAAKKALAREAD